MKKRILIVLAFFAFAGVWTARAATPAFAVGQEWSYETRRGESDSRLVILRIDPEAKQGDIIHIAIVSATLRLRGQPPIPWTIDHMPFAGIALRKSVTKLEKTGSTAVFPNFEKSYADWKQKADSGNKQFWTPSVAKALGDLEAMIQKSRK